MPWNTTQLGGLMVAQPGEDPQTGVTSIEIPIILPTAAFTNRFIDSSLTPVPGRIKTLVIVVDTAITSAGAQQATVQLFAARSRFTTAGSDTGPSTGGPIGAAAPLVPFVATQGAASQFPTTGLNATQAVGLPVNFGPSVASLGGAGAVFWFTATFPGSPTANPPTSMTELSEMYPVLGIEITAPATFTAGVARAFFDMAPI
jgi:hypothetical protein